MVGEMALFDKTACLVFILSAIISFAYVYTKTEMGGGSVFAAFVTALLLWSLYISLRAIYLATRKDS